MLWLWIFFSERARFLFLIVTCQRGKQGSMSRSSPIPGVSVIAVVPGWLPAERASLFSSLWMVDILGFRKKCGWWMCPWPPQICPTHCGCCCWRPRACHPQGGVVCDSKCCRWRPWACHPQGGVACGLFPVFPGGLWACHPRPGYGVVNLNRLENMARLGGISLPCYPFFPSYPYPPPNICPV